MKKICTSLVLATCLVGALNAAPVKKPSSNGAKNLQKGSITNGVKATGSVQRWMLFNEGSIGGSWSKIGKSEFVSLDFGYATSITTIATAGGLRGIFGVNFEFPLYLSAAGYSNALKTDRNFSDVLGWGAIVPLSVGIDVGGFQLTGLVGYSYHSIKEEFNGNGVSNAKMLTQYHGVVYGASLGYRIANIINLKAHALFGKLKNDWRSTENEVLRQEEVTSNKKYNYMNLGASVSIVF
ncbi:hypothetical protein CQA62_05390 [Helicobacter cholecystus]|uniref:Uncharacterized protein n=1 Tax=Helicobacter cholecystus TaxID=45498 RepID=A0A3D8IW66_9HELI|nr:hypothetical protein [Helicobacter cholecystus]RDU68821.1 hypothetical protein CQA62_05390 [Helicobacter cholecystus]VEJ23901.1 outer membrane protein [Helicobacter cholecystus]